MNLSDRPSTWSIKVAKAWFVLGLLIAAYHVFRDGIGWSLLDLVIPVTGLYVLAYRYPWGRIFTIVMLSITLARVAWDAVPFVWIMLRSIYRSFTADENILRQLDQFGARPDPQYLTKTLLILLVVGMLALFLWLIVDLLHNENVKRYFVSKKELSAEQRST